MGEILEVPYVDFSLSESTTVLTTKILHEGCPFRVSSRNGTFYIAQNYATLPNKVLLTAVLNSNTYRLILFSSYQGNMVASAGTENSAIRRVETDGTDTLVDGYYYDSSSKYYLSLDRADDSLLFEPFATLQEADNALRGYGNYPITYRLTNATAPSAPTEAGIGDTVTVDFEFPEGYGIVNPQTDIYVTCNGVTVPSSYSAGRLVFTMPDPT